MNGYEIVNEALSLHEIDGSTVAQAAKKAGIWQRFKASAGNAANALKGEAMKGSPEKWGVNIATRRPDFGKWYQKPGRYVANIWRSGKVGKAGVIGTGMAGAAGAAKAMKKND